MVIVTEQGYADLRDLTPKERAEAIIENCAHPDCQGGAPRLLPTEPAPKLRAKHRIILDEALSWHSRYEKTGSMK